MYQKITITNIETHNHNYIFSLIFEPIKLLFIIRIIGFFIRPEINKIILIMTYSIATHAYTYIFSLKYLHFNVLIN